MLFQLHGLQINYGLHIMYSGDDLGNTSYDYAMAWNAYSLCDTCCGRKPLFTSESPTKILQIDSMVGKAPIQYLLFIIVYDFNIFKWV